MTATQRARYVDALLLKTVANGCTRSEAESATLAAQRLMDSTATADASEQVDMWICSECGRAAPPNELCTTCLKGQVERTDWQDRMRRAANKQTAEQARTKPTAKSSPRWSSGGGSGRVYNSDAYARTQAHKSEVNDQKVRDYFSAEPFSIPLDEIVPRVNCFTYEVWKTQGRKVRKGQNKANGCGGCPVPTMILKNRHDPSKGMRPSTAYVFHISQTEVL